MNLKMLKAIEFKVRTNWTQREIASKLDVREETVSRWFKRDDVSEKLKEEQRAYLDELIPKAIRTQAQLLGAKSEHVRHLAACDILDRGGYKATDKIDMSVDLPTIISGDEALAD